MTLADAYPFPFEYLNPEKRAAIVRLWDKDWNLVLEYKVPYLVSGAPQTWLCGVEQYDLMYRTIDYPNGSRHSDALVRTEYGLEVRTYEDLMSNALREFLGYLGITALQSEIDSILSPLFEDIYSAHRAWFNG